MGEEIKFTDKNREIDEPGLKILPLVLKKRISFKELALHFM